MNSQRLNQPPASKHEEKDRVRRKSVLSGPVSFVLIVIALIFVMSVMFRVNNIIVEGNEHYTDNEIIQAVDIEEGDNLFFFDRFAAVSRVFSKLPYIEEVSVKRTLPDKVVVTVEERTALAYIVLGEEEWTIDNSCKILGKSAEGEIQTLIAITGIHPGTLLIGEKLTTEDGNTDIVDYIAEVLYQIEERGMAPYVSRVDFSDPNNVKFDYDSTYTMQIGGHSNVEYKFGMIVSVLGKLLEGDTGVINVSDGNTAHFIPE